MGLDGGGAGGGGIVGVGDSFTGAAQSLDIYGDFAAAYSGVLDTSAVQGEETTYLEFTTGNFLFVGHLLANHLDEGAGTDDMVYAIYFNDSQVQGYRASSAGPYTEPDNLVPLIIPSYTAVKVTTKNITAGSARSNVISLTGRIYRT